MNTRKLTTKLLPTLGAFAATMLLAGGSASALLTHTYTGHSIGPTGTGPGTFNDVQGVAVDQNTGNLYVLDATSQGEGKGSTGTLSRFNAAGEPAPFSGLGTNVIAKIPVSVTRGEDEIAVDSSSGPAKGDIYIANGTYGTEIEKVYIYGSSGLSRGELSPHVEATSRKLCGVAVDPSGHVYVDEESGTHTVTSFINKYTPIPGPIPVDGEDFSASFGAQNSERSCDVAVDSEGNVYAVHNVGNAGSVIKYSESQFNVEGQEAVGTTITPGRPDGGGVGTVAVDPSGGDDDLYVDQGSEVERFDSSGDLLEVFGGSGPGALNGLSWGVAVDHASHDVYVSSGSGRVEIFGPGPVLPDVGTGAASGVEKTSVTVGGTVDPDGIAVGSCEFEYRSAAEESYGHNTPVACANAPGSGNAPVVVSAKVEGLTAGVNYVFRLVAGNANGTEPGSDHSFQTPPAVDGVSTGAAEDVLPGSAKLTGSLAPDGMDAHYYFQYGTELSYGSVSPALPGTDAGNATESVSASTALAGLVANTTYHYRLVAVNTLGATYGEDQTFTTPPAVEGVSTGGAEEVTPNTAKLTGVLSPDGTDAHYYFQYGTKSSYGSVSPALPGTDAGVAEESVPASTVLSGLTAGTVYHYRLVAVNSFGTTYGEDRTFETVPAVELVFTAGAEDVLGTGVKLVGFMREVPGVDVKYWFEYGRSEAFGQRTPTVDAGEVSTFPSTEVSASVTGLEPNEVYYDRLVAEDAAGIAYGEEAGEPKATFKTAPVAPVLGGVFSASGATRTTVVLRGGVDAENSATIYHFAYVAQAAYQVGAIDPYAAGGETTLTSAGSGFGEAPVQQLAGGLEPDTTYHYALVASNQAGTVMGPDGTFTTGSTTLPLVLTGGVSGVSQNDATISAMLNTEGLPATYGFEIGTSTNYGPPTGLGSVGAGFSEAAVTLALSGLQPGTTYHYRVEASNIDGTVYGADQTFTTAVFANAFATPPAPLPFLAVPAIAFPAETPPSSGKPVLKGKPQRKHKTKVRRKPHKHASKRHGRRAGSKT